MGHVVQFGDFRFDRDSGQLWSGSKEQRLTPKSAAVLRTLIGHPGQPVTKQVLFDTVWKGTVVSDDALSSCIQELRRALHDDPRQPRYIETRHRSGYRFVAALTESAAESVPAPDISTIAVLPFTDMSPGRDQDYLCEGLAEEIINSLTRLDGLRVVSRTASFQFRAAGMDIRDVGRRLNVGALLEGSVRKSGNQLRVTVQLIDIDTGFHRWSERFDRGLEDVFAIEDEIAESVATNLRGSMLSSRERHALLRPETGSAAYEYYLRGRQHLPRMTRADLLKSAAMFERAIQLDANYAPAYAGLATVHATLHEWFGASAEDLTRAERASMRALELAPGLAETHAARGFVLTLSGSYDSASLEFEQAIRINPNLFDAYYYFARAAFANGHLELSADLFGRAARARVEDFQSVALQAQSLQWLGRQEEAAMVNRESIRRAERLVELNPSDIRTLSLGSGSLYRDGQHERALEWSQRALDLNPDDLSAIMNAVCLHANLGRKERALDLLERAVAQGWGHRDWIERDKDYDSLRDDPRFCRLMSRLK
jgi:TolB-like protein/Flp pilus assembly protein TadD